MFVDWQFDVESYSLYLQVHLKCGLEHKLIGSSEPSRCEYAFDFETPCRCSQPLDTAQQKHDELWFFSTSNHFSIFVYCFIFQSAFVIELGIWLIRKVFMLHIKYPLNRPSLFCTISLFSTSWNMNYQLILFCPLWHCDFWIFEKYTYPWYKINAIHVYCWKISNLFDEL